VLDVLEEETCSGSLAVRGAMEELFARVQVGKREEGRKGGREGGRDLMERK